MQSTAHFIGFRLLVIAFARADSLFNGSVAQLQQVLKAVYIEIIDLTGRFIFCVVGEMSITMIKPTLYILKVDFTSKVKSIIKFELYTLKRFNNLK